MAIIYDLECATLGRGPNPYTNVMKLFGYLNTETGECKILRYGEVDAIQAILNMPDDKVSYNGRSYDNIILRKAGFQIKGRHIDLCDIARLKKSELNVRSVSLKNVGVALNLEVEKGDVDYSIFNDDELIEKNWDVIAKYLLADLQMTSKIYEKWKSFIESRESVKLKLLERYLGKSIL
jgi:hypothetical protein